MLNSLLIVKTVPIHLLILDRVPIFEQLQIEEAILRADDRNWCILNTGSPPAIVMGISGKPELLIDQACMQACPVPVIRRFSGGGTVFIDHDTYFATWICNVDHSNAACSPDRVHYWVADFYQKAFPSLGMRLEENDYVIGERKFGGNAQYLCKGRWLHHTSLLWDYHSDNMRYLLMPPKIPKYRQQRGHDEFICRLRDHFPKKQDFANAFKNAIRREFDVCEVSLDDVKEITDRPHRKMNILEKNDC